MLRSLIGILILFFISHSGFSNPEIITYNFEEFKKNILDSHENEDLMIINFWATWCGPCVRELPHFEEINQEYKSKQVRVVLVSLDFENQYEKKLIPFIQRKNLQSELIWLNDTKYNDWIDQVTPQWSGAIPATVLMRGGKVLDFYEKELSVEDLQKAINQLL